MKVVTGVEYDCKLEICKESNIVVLTKYHNVIKSDKARIVRSRCLDTTEEEYQDNKRANVYRAAKKIMKLVRYNAGMYKKSNGSKYPPIFLTLTFADNVTDWEWANKEFKKFVMRLNYWCYGSKVSDLRYISVPELQERGAIHYHILFFNLPYIDKSVVQELWGLGSTRIEQERKFQDMEGDNLGRYITKYMTKQFYSKDKEGNDNFYYSKDLWEGKKIFFASRNLIKPQVFKFTKEELKSIDFAFDNLVSDEPIVHRFGDEEIIKGKVMEFNLGIDNRNYILDVVKGFNDKDMVENFVVRFKSADKFNKYVDLGKNVVSEFFIDDVVHFSFGSVTRVSGCF